jgi:glycosyltransferase involved in cell wall biosynthesis
VSPLPRILLLYRPHLPGQRAQAIQVTSTARALAAAGACVTLLADRGEEPADRRRALAALGLDDHPNLDLRISPVRHKTLAGLWFRAALRDWWRGPSGVVIARDKVRLLHALASYGPRGHLLLLEAHELDSAQCRDEGADPRKAFHQEQSSLAQIHGLIGNCEGTLAAWQSAHTPFPHLPLRAIPNAIDPQRARLGADVDPVIRVFGSFLAQKGIRFLLQAAPQLPLPLHLFGGPRSALPATLPANLEVYPPISYTEVPNLAAAAQALLLPLSDNRFGRTLTSPLKLWDYLSTDRPIIAPDLPTVREVMDKAGQSCFYHTPGDTEDLVRAARAACMAPPRPPFIRTWDQRAQELLAFIETVDSTSVKPRRTANPGVNP